MRFLLLLLMMVKLVDMQLSAEIFSCSDETKRKVLHFPEYTHIQICCQLTSKLCNGTTSNDTLTLLPELGEGCNGSCASQMYREGNCLVKFEISNTSFFVRKYSCKLNERKMMSQDVYIIKKPPTPNITSFSCSLKNVRTVAFDRGPPSPEYHDVYNVTMIEGSKEYVMCNNTQEACKPSDNICVCKMALSESLNPSSDVTIIVSVVRSVQTSETRKNFSVAAHIIPGPVKRLHVSHIGSHDANIKFCMDVSTTSFCSFMALNKQPLYFDIWAYKEQGIPEILRVTIPTAMDDFPFCVSKCLQVNLTSLTTFTNYTVIVSGRGGGGDSEKSKLEFTTSQTKPVYSPLVDDFGFRILESHNVGGKILSSLFLIWKPLPHEARGGREFCYHIEITSKYGFPVYTTTADAYAVISNQYLPPGPFTVKIWSQNVLGRSQNYTRFEIPQKMPETEVPYVIVELKGDRAFVNVNLTVRTELTLLVHWCYIDTIQATSGFSICQDYPSTAAFTLKAATSKTHQTLAVNISESVELKEIQEHRIINYYNLDFLSSSLNVAKTVNATVIMNDLRAIQEMKGYNFYDEEVDPIDDDYYYDVFRKRRNVQELGSSNEEKIRFFISFKMGESMSSTGMIPASCYFDAGKDQVSLIVSDFPGSSSDSVTLRWSQNCDTDVPKQFLADYFHVYSSTDEHCKENKNYLGRVNNTLFQPNLLKVPPDAKFACIQTYKQDGWSAAGLTVSAIGNYNKVKTPGSVLIYVLVPIAVVLILIITVLAFCFRKRHVGKFRRGNITLPPAEEHFDVPDPVKRNSAFSVPEQSVYSDQISVNFSNDSGRGTDTDSKHANADDVSNSLASSAVAAITGSSSDKSSHLDSELPGNFSRFGLVIQNDCSSNKEDVGSSKNTERNDCNSHNNESNDCRNNEDDDDNCSIPVENNSNTDGEAGSGSGKTHESSSDSAQQEALLKCGLLFNRNNESSSSSSATSGEESYSGDSSGDQRVTNSGKKVKVNSNNSISITEENSRCTEEEEISFESESECQQRGVSSCSNRDSRQSFRCSESPGKVRQNFENNIPNGAECKPQDSVAFIRYLSSGSESEGDEKPFLV